MTVPLAFAILFMVVGLFGALFWVYLSIFCTVIAVPCLILGIVLLVRR